MYLAPCGPCFSICICSSPDASATKGNEVQGRRTAKSRMGAASESPARVLVATGKAEAANRIPGCFPLIESPACPRGRNSSGVPRLPDYTVVSRYKRKAGQQVRPFHTQRREQRADNAITLPPPRFLPRRHSGGQRQAKQKSTPNLIRVPCKMAAGFTSCRGSRPWRLSPRGTSPRAWL